ncbi:MAG: branched-chain amino acid ABC transporter permease [Clostridiales bacterium]|nr:branched-chain amino acid ABC transporter permease [Clostridiales bacterium]
MELVKKVFWETKAAKIQALAILAAFVFMMFIPSFSGAYPPLFLAWVMTYCTLSISWTFFSGKTGYISLATAAFYGLGMYLQAVIGREFPLGVTILLAALLAFGVGFGIGLITLRLRGIYFTIFTFGLALFLNRFFHWYEGVFTRTKGRFVKTFDNDMVFYAVLIVFIVTLVAILLMNKSRFGLSLTCIGQNEDSAQHIGVNTTLTKVLAFAISAAPAGAVGAAMISTVGYVDPDLAFRMLASFFPVLMAIFGGMFSTYGPIVGAVIFYVLQDYLLRTTNLYMVIFGTVMVVVVLVLPKGIFGLIDSMIAKKQRGYSGEVIGDV